MARIKVVPIYPEESLRAKRIAQSRYKQLIDLAEYSRIHELTDCATDADIVVFYVDYSFNTDLLGVGIRAHPVYREHKEKVLVFDSDDKPLPMTRGLYVGVDVRWYDKRFYRTGPYIHDYLWNDSLDLINGANNARWLFSFLGDRSTHSCRREVMQLTHERGRIEDTSMVNPWMDKEAKDIWSKSYVDSIVQSKFVLCPRGRSSSSVRMYEVMRAGRVPVVISDAWVPPTGLEWDTFSIRVKEDEIAQIPKRLEAMESCAQRMGDSARLNWEKWFCKEVLFDRIVDWLFEVHAGLEVGEGRRRFALAKYVLTSPDQVRRCLLRPLKRIVTGAVINTRNGAFD